MRLISTGIVSALAAASFGFVSSAPVDETHGPDVSALAWLAGTWTGTEGETETEEVWLAPKGGAMLGLHRDVVGDLMVSFEFLRISMRKDTVAYIASPNGAQPTVFLLKESAEKRVVFENLKNDYPQRIIYWLEKDGALHARIEGDKNGRKEPMEWTWRQRTEAASRPK